MNTIINPRVLIVQLWTKDIDNEIIILEALLQQHENYRVTEIKRSLLKEICEDILYEKSKGLQDAYGGAFQRGLKL